MLIFGWHLLKLDHQLDFGTPFNGIFRITNCWTQWQWRYFEYLIMYFSTGFGMPFISILLCIIFTSSSSFISSLISNEIRTTSTSFLMSIAGGTMSSTSFLIPFVVGSTFTPFLKTMTKGIKSFNKNQSSFDKSPRYDMLRRIRSFSLSQAPKLLWIAKFCGNLPLPCCQVVAFNFMCPKNVIWWEKLHWYNLWWENSWNP